MIALLSIKPEFVREIFQGQKRYEYRKKAFAKNVTKVIVYSTKPVGMIVGEFSVKDILKLHPSELWDKTRNYSGISKQYFNEYFNGRDEGYAIHIEKPTLYEHPINPHEVFGSFTPPQSFMYVQEAFISKLNK